MLRVARGARVSAGEPLILRVHRRCDARVAGGRGVVRSQKGRGHKMAWGHKIKRLCSPMLRTPPQTSSGRSAHTSSTQH